VDKKYFAGISQDNGYDLETVLACLMVQQY